MKNISDRLQIDLKNLLKNILTQIIPGVENVTGYDNVQYYY